MKNLIVVAFTLIASFVMSQAPQKMTYQAVVRDASNILLSNTSVGVQISILQTSPTGLAVFIERHNVITNLNGLATLEIGSGTPVAGSFTGIDWAAGPYYLKNEIDPNGGTTYSITGTSELLSVPYALYAANAGSQSTPQILSLNGSNLTLSDGGGTVSINDADSDATNELQTLEINGQQLSISNGNSIAIPSSSLDLAYDNGGSGNGRSITVDAGAVELNNSGSNTIGLQVNSAVNNSTGIFANQTGIGVGVRAESTNSSNTYSVIQANTNSSLSANAAILGNNSGAGYGVTGQIPSTATGDAGIYGNNLRTTDGAGVLGVGFYGVFGQTNDVTNGWSGYFTQDIGVDGTGYSVGGWNTVSDGRLKSEIVPIDNALEKLLAINGTYYTVTSKTKLPSGEIKFNKRKQYGVIAQELELIYPEMISEKAVFINSGDETVYKTVQYTQLIPVMIESIKELNNKITDLERKIKLLESN